MFGLFFIYVRFLLVFYLFIYVGIDGNGYCYCSHCLFTLSIHKKSLGGPLKHSTLSPIGVSGETLIALHFRSGPLGVESIDNEFEHIRFLI